MAIAQLDLTNRPARCVDLPKNCRRSAHAASLYSTQRRVAASPDLNSRRRGIEVRLEHRLSLSTIPLSCAAVQVHIYRLGWRKHAGGRPCKATTEFDEDD